MNIYSLHLLKCYHNNALEKVTLILKPSPTSMYQSIPLKYRSACIILNEQLLICVYIWTCGHHTDHSSEQEVTRLLCDSNMSSFRKFPTKHFPNLQKRIAIKETIEYDCGIYEKIGENREIIVRFERVLYVGIRF